MLAVVVISATTHGQNCDASGRPLHATYDRLADSTVAEADPHTFGALSGQEFTLRAAAVGRASGDVVPVVLVARYIEAAKTPEALAAIPRRLTDDAIFVALVDDSVRFAWRPVRSGATTERPGPFGVRRVETATYAPSPDDLARFVAGQHAVVRFAGREDAVKRASLARMADVVRWASCPSSR